MEHNYNRIISFALALIVVLSYVNVRTFAAEPRFTVDAKSAIIMEASTGDVLFEQNADEKLAPASVTKVMTMLLIYEALAQDKIKWDDIVTVSAHAASMGGSQIFLEVNEQQPVRDLVKAVVIASANDAAVAMGEFISGSDSAFVDLMNQRAKDLGMLNTSFKNACGLDADGHYTSARDIALMSRELIVKYPEVLELAQIWMDTITHKTAKGESEFGLTNTNKLIKWYNGATGLKTGSTGKALYCLSATAERDGLSLISVVLGSPTPAQRFGEVMKMFDFGFANYMTIKGDETGTVVGQIPIQKGTADFIDAAVKEQISRVVPKGNSADGLSSEILLDAYVTAPVAAGSKCGEIVYTYNGEVIGRIDLVTKTDVGKASLFDMLRKTLDLIAQ
jgi:D-alanyl-D-alanine carboxypeptidase (penicillin-binding protein 5/6)